MEKITLLKPFRQTETYRLVELEEAVDMIRGEEYRQVTENLRDSYPMFQMRRLADGHVTGADFLTDQLPRLCFAQLQEKRNGVVLGRGYNALALLEVNNLTGYDEAAAIRRGAGEMPQTLLAFVGASGRSVKIVVRGATPPQQKGEERNGGQDDASSVSALPQTAEELALFHENLYERARLAYNMQLGVTIEKLEPRLDRICYVSYDPGAVFNPLALPLYARAEKPTEALALIRPSTREADEVSPGCSRYLSLYHAYEFNMERAADSVEGMDDDDERLHRLLTLLAQFCMESGIPLGIAKRLTYGRIRFMGGDELLVDKLFGNIYRPEVVQRYQEKKSMTLERYVPQETLLTMKIDLFLQENYEIRKNVMRGVAEFRERSGIGFAYRDLTEEARNSMTLRALRQGIKCWDKDIRRYVNSEDIELYDPLNEWLEQLPHWDGKDRVEELAKRVPTTYKEWPELFRLWMRSMVAMWLGKGQLTGNALVPLLIGRQGCGKSSFCRLLLPRDLQEYYNDRINFKNENDLNLGLTSFALINLDEFDRVTQRQQIVLKYLVSTSDLKYRPPYGKAYTQHRRFASFIGTTNESQPLSDPSGSRRFVCTPVSGDIDFRTPLDHRQLYAQLLWEINQGERYWPSREQEEALIVHNGDYRPVSGLQEMLAAVIEKPANAGDGRWMTLGEISQMLKSRFSSYKEDASTFRKLGASLNRPDYRFDSRHTKTGAVYFVRQKTE
jgi:hypothetical protein